jgi:hypothetical protein
MCLELHIIFFSFIIIKTTVFSFLTSSLKKNKKQKTKSNNKKKQNKNKPSNIDFRS